MNSLSSTPVQERLNHSALSLLITSKNKSMVKTKNMTVPIIARTANISTSNRNFFSEKFQTTTLLVDLALLNLSFFLGFYFSDLEITIFTRTSYKSFSFLLLANIIWLTIACYHDIYKWYEIIRPFKKVKNLLFVNGLFFSVLANVYCYIFYPNLSVQFLLISFSFFLLVNIWLHLFFRKYYYQKMPVFEYIIVGGKQRGRQYIQDLHEKNYGHKSRCLGWFTNKSFMNGRRLGNYQDLKKFLNLHSVDKLFYINSDLPKREVRELIDLCENKFIDFEIIASEFEIFGGDTRVVNQDSLPILAPKMEPLQRLRNKIVKRIFDIIFSLLVIIFIYSWLVPIIAIVIKLESTGPVFFNQIRTGYWNKPFQFTKFRSMKTNKSAHLKQASYNDPRVTKFGAFLRKTSLDEIPQFINVLKGDMSVVGPRPHMIKHTEEYSNLIDTYLVRHKIKPGITGWAQINGYRGPTETLDKMQKRVEFDVHYIKNWSLIMDIRCIIFTIINMFSGEKNAL